MIGLLRVALVAIPATIWADRWGRRNIMMVTVIGFAFFNGLTAFVTDKYQFAACQLLARLFLTAEYSLALIMAGAIGNGIDRVVHGHVIDFLDFYWSGVGHFPAFNIADIGISVGAVLFIIDELRRVEKS